MHVDDWEWEGGAEEKEQKVWQRRAQWLAMMARGLVGTLVEEAIEGWGAEKWVVMAKFAGEWPNTKSVMAQECEAILAMIEEMLGEEERAEWMAGILFWVVIYLVGGGRTD